MTHAARSAHKIRAEIAQLAAKLIASEGVGDFLVAKRKAAERLGIRSDRGMPTNVEIEAALREYQRLFQSHSQPDRVQALRRAALQAMEFLARFRPRLTGAVLHGTATDFSEVTLHLYCNVAEEVALHLADAGIGFEHSARSLRTGPGESTEFPALKFLAGDTPVVLILFTEALEATTPLSPVDGRPMRRATLPAVRALLDAGAGAGSGRQ
jgi:hypothetical protein